MDVKEILARVGEELSVRRVFGEPFERDGALIVPAAVVAGGGGGGVDPKGAPTPDGSSTDDAPDQPSDHGKKQPAAGAGYGGGTCVRSASTRSRTARSGSSRP